MELNLFSAKGKKTNKKIKVDDSIFNCKINKKVIEQSIYVYSSNQRESNAHTKIKSEVRGGGRKPWRQKGTGRARQGSIRSPIWKGGGIVFGPRKERNYKRNLSKKLKGLAIRSVLSWLFKNKRIIVIENTEFEDKHLTKQLIDLTNKLGLSKKVLYIYSSDNKKLYLASRNLFNIKAININELNTYELMNHVYIVILQDTLKRIEERWGLKQKVDKEEKKGNVKFKLLKDKKNEDKGKEKFPVSQRLINILKKEGVLNSDDLRRFLKDGKKVRGLGKQSIDKLNKYLKVK